MNHPPRLSEIDSNEAALDRLLAELTASLRSGEQLDLEKVVQSNPQWEADLRELWPALLMLEELAPPLLSMKTTPSYAASHGVSRSLPQAFDDYEIIAEVGRGGMGVVYCVRQKSLNRRVALKMLTSGELASSEEISRFRSEAAAIGQLDHPHIVPIYETGEHQGRAYFTMKYIEGETLAAKVARGPFPAMDAAHLMLILASAIDHAHAKGIFHRDLKPSNVLIDQAGQPHITDFGLAKINPIIAATSEFSSTIKPMKALSLTQSGAILGTPSYMPPEQAGRFRGQLTPACDVYSLGAILYHLLTGRPPFQAATLVDTVMLMLEQDPVPPRLLNPNVPHDLESICLKCLQKPIDLRYASAAALAADLQAFLEGRPITAGPESLVQFVFRMLRPTHHAAVLENWGLLWMWHSFVVFFLCAVTNGLKELGYGSHVVYMALWGTGLSVWAYFFWNIRLRGGPINFVERQIAHVWAGAIFASIALFMVEILLDMPALKLSPVLAIIAGMVFLIKGGTLSGSFYFTAGGMFLCAIAMAIWPRIDVLLFGIVSAVAFFTPGYMYYRQRRTAQHKAQAEYAQTYVKVQNT